MTLRARLTLLLLGAVEVTFISAVGAYWGLRSWRNLADELTLIHEQQRALLALTTAIAVPDGNDGEARAALETLQRNAQTVDESEHVERLATAARSARPLQTQVRALADYYEREQSRIRARGAALAQISNALLVAIVVLVIASFVGFLAAIRVWLVEPVRALERATEVMSTGNLSHRIAITGDDELGRLAAAINRMAGSLAHIQARLVAAERFALLGELAAYVAHNIRNPLASIRATAQGEAIDIAAGNPQQAVFEDIIRAVDRLDAWVGDMLRSLSPIALQSQPGSLNELVERCVELAGPQVRAAGVGLALHVRPTPTAWFDSAKLEQVVGAVLANALDVSPRGTCIAVELECGDGLVVLRISDAGPGIPAERRAQLFAPFSTGKVSGTGIGLW
ncbi:MAG TPA: ATP-binding protein, partial [Rhizomicrobium sp.]